MRSTVHLFFVPKPGAKLSGTKSPPALKCPGQFGAGGESVREFLNSETSKLCTLALLPQHL